MDERLIAEWQRQAACFQRDSAIEAGDALATRLREVADGWWGRFAAKLNKERDEARAESKRLRAFAQDVRRIALERVEFYDRAEMDAAAQAWQQIVDYCEGTLKP